MRKWIALLCSLPVFAGCDFEPYIPAEMETIQQSQVYSEEKILNADVRFDVGELEITGGKGMESLYIFNLEYDKSEFEPDVQYNSDSTGEGRLSFSLPRIHKPGLRKEGFSNSLRLQFNDSIPLDLEVDTEMANTRLSLSGLRVSGVVFESGVGGAKLFVYEPNPIVCEFVRLKNGVGSIDAIGLGNLNFRELEFEGGVGGADLDFTGNWRQDADVRIQVGIGGVHLRIPRSLGVRLETEKYFFREDQLEGFIQRGIDYYSENYESAPVKVFMRVATHIGGLKITWV
ncbi:MAG: LiaF-related protein [Acidobacteriota bacterium]|jgi:hypothetical protein